MRLVQEMSTTFGNDPPLFARPQNQPVQRIPTTPISPSVQIKQDATVRVRRAATLRLAQLKAAIDVELKAQQKLHALTDSAAETERRASQSRRAADAAVLELGAAQDQLRRWYAATYEDPPVPSLEGDADAAALLAALARANAAEDALASSTRRSRTGASASTILSGTCGASRGFSERRARREQDARARRSSEGAARRTGACIGVLLEAAIVLTREEGQRKSAARRRPPGR